MSSLYHLRIDVRKIQDYIFQVPKLKYMLGANSKIGELFEHALPRFMGNPVTLFPSSIMDNTTCQEVKEQFGKNILSSSGGHLEALFRNESEMKEMFARFTEHVAKELPDLEWTASYRVFDPEKSYRDFRDAKIEQLRDISGIAFTDSPYFQLCANDGISPALKHEHEKEEAPMGKKSELMFEQADKFYNLESLDGLTKFLLDIGVNSGSLAKSLEKLAEEGTSSKRNMLAYIRLDGNGTGERYRRCSKKQEDENVLVAFAEIENFWCTNRRHIRTALQEILTGKTVAKYQGRIKPFLPLMLGGDDLFMVCVPEIALDLALELSGKLEETCPVSVGIAFTKTNYPIGLAARLADSCLESAKAASYRKDSNTKPPFIDWHVHFDSFFQDVEDIRRNSYMLEYKDGNDTVLELLSDRPYPNSELSTLLNSVKEVAKDLDKPESERANSKIKGFRSVLKDGHAEVEYFKSMIVRDDEKLKDFFGPHTELGRQRDRKVLLNAALDKIELIEFYRSKPGREA